MPIYERSYVAKWVALLAEGVDRNSVQASACASYSVALLAEGVDRNQNRQQRSQQWGVALLAEGVDRNSDDAFAYWAKMGRPPRGGRG